MVHIQGVRCGNDSRVAPHDLCNIGKRQVGNGMTSFADHVGVFGRVFVKPISLTVHGDLLNESFVYHQPQIAIHGSDGDTGKARLGFQIDIVCRKVSFAGTDDVVNDLSLSGHCFPPFGIGIILNYIITANFNLSIVFLKKIKFFFAFGKVLFGGRLPTALQETCFKPIDGCK